MPDGGATAKPALQLVARVERKGLRQLFHPSDADCFKAALWSAAEARKKRWVDADGLMQFLITSIGNQLHRTVWVKVVGYDMASDQPFLEIRTEEWIAHYQVDEDTWIGV